MSIHFESQRQNLLKNITDKNIVFVKLLIENFLVQPCTKCHEFTMRLLEISPNARSVHYQCVHCNKKMRAAAGTEKASDIIPVWSKLKNLVDDYNRKYTSSQILSSFEFETAAAPLPFEQTSRSPISESVRSEVWRRDRGQCVFCGSKENLQFDHIIPVSRGGATTAQNLQLLCQQCNLAKGSKI
jgi:hypothetical protein